MKNEHEDREVATSAPRAGLNRLAIAIEVPAIIVTMIMMIHIAANALLRAFASSPVAYTNEVTEYWYMPLVVFLGFMAAQLRDEHVKADFIYGMLPKVARRYVLGIAYTVITLVCIGFTWFGALEAMQAFSTLRQAGISPLPAWPTYFLPPLAFGVMTIQFAVVSISLLKGKEVEDENSSESQANEVEEIANRG